ncbi:MAG: putative endonuclease [Alphaproteobacteria bacterium]|jgi:putative endonuclease
MLKELVFYECYQSINEALKREKQLKMWKRDWKLNLVESFNPNWYDLYDDLNR